MSATSIPVTLAAPGLEESLSDAEALEAAPYELKALKAFASTDKTRPHMTCVWLYASDGGRTYFATDGHTMVVRRSGTHVDMPQHVITRLEARAVGVATPTGAPSLWSTVLCRPDHEGKHPAVRGVDPAYVGRVALVEVAAGKRQAQDYYPKPGVSKQNAAEMRACLRTGACSEWTLGCGPLDGWYFRVPAGPAVWEGMIMPRRV